MKKKPNKSASALGKLSVESRKAKYGITNWSEHMKKVRNGKKIEVKPVKIQNIPSKLDLK
jgi:hypothetical protein